LEEENMRIDVTEAIELLGYSIGKEAKEELLKHYKKYQNWGRIKQILIAQICSNNRDRLRDKKELERYRYERQFTINFKANSPKDEEKE
jgi:hypothetical protein